MKPSVLDWDTTSEFKPNQLMRQIGCCTVRVIMIGFMIVGTAVAADKIYEQPSAFLGRHFGEMPKPSVLALNDDQQKKIKEILGHAYGQQRVRYWASSGKHGWILEEIGKTEPITTGIVIQNHAITEVKVLIYRESHGWEVSRPFFTKQFEGATLNGEKLNHGVDGIVGATLSVRALTKLSAMALYLDQQIKD
jgi:hypothetical protein